MLDCVLLARDLIRFNTTNPPGDEADCAAFVVDVLKQSDVAAEIVRFGERRANVLARIEGRTADVAPLVLTGHLDTVPLGAAPWTKAPLEGEIVDGRLFGRGASDMKGGVAAMLTAFVRAARAPQARGVTLLLTGGEEVGCQGAVHLKAACEDKLGEASAMLVGEPTNNQAVPGHKGALFMHATTKGVTAHSSMPERGDNAIYKAARAVTKVEDYRFGGHGDVFMGPPTINVGMISGGMNANSVPDRATFTIDVRSGPSTKHADIMSDLSERLGRDVALTPFIDMPPVFTQRADPFVEIVDRACKAVLGEGATLGTEAIPFFSDASVFQPHYQCPTVILGPGERDQAHKTDEFCLVERITQAEAIYLGVIEAWCR